MNGLTTVFKRVLTAFALVFLLPAFATAGWWVVGERPASWREADWSSSGVLPAATAGPEAAIYVLAARTGGLKGAVSTHSWIVVKRPLTGRYDRYDKVGWGRPVRRNAYAADGRWYSNTPEIIGFIGGAAAARLIPAVEAAIAAYPFSGRGDYRIFPGPNSNSFVAHVLRAVPELGITLPPTAVGRDYPTDGRAIALDDGTLRATLAGLVGFSASLRGGLEIHIGGLVAGFDIAPPAVFVPAYGRVGMRQGQAQVSAPTY